MASNTLVTLAVFNDTQRHAESGLEFHRFYLAVFGSLAAVLNPPQLDQNKGGMNGGKQGRKGGNERCGKGKEEEEGDEDEGRL